MKEAEKEKLRQQEAVLTRDLEKQKQDIELRKAEIKSMQDKMQKALNDNKSLESSEKGALERESQTRLDIKQFRSDINRLEKELSGNKDIEQLLKDG